MENNTAPEQQNPVFAVEKIYVKDLSLEVPHAPAIFLESEAPQVDIQINTTGNHLGEGAYEVVLTVTVQAALGEKTVFLVEVGQAGIFRILNVPEDQIEPLIAIACANLLYPYAREAVSDAVTRAGFIPVVLQPVNFEALYMARLQEQQAAPATEQ